MALVRVYCGLVSADAAGRQASVASELTVAVVDDAGRLLGVHEVSDTPAGYAWLAAQLVERSSSLSGVAIAADSDDHLITSLLTAAGRPLALADDDSVDDFAERFADDDSAEEMQSPPDSRRAVGLARALQAGAISAGTLPTPRELATYKPVLAAHLAMINGRHSAATTLREVLRELYPAALRAYPDPAAPLPLHVLDAVPEPGRLTAAGPRGRDAADTADDVIAELVRAGVADEQSVAEAVTALRVAIGESPRRGGVNKSLAPAVADAVRHAVAVVRSADAACHALVSTLTARIGQPVEPAPGRRSTARRPVEQPAPGVVGGGSVATGSGRRGRAEPVSGPTPAAPRPVTSPPVAPQPLTPPPVAPAPVAPPPIAPAASAGLPNRSPATPPTGRPVSAPPPPPPGMNPMLPNPRGTVPPADAGQPFRPTITNAAINSARAERQRTVIPPRPNTRGAGAAPPTGHGATDYSLPMPVTRPNPEAEPGSRANWPLVNTTDEASERAAEPVSPSGRVRPPWQSDDLPKEPPSLRLVEPQLTQPAGEDRPAGSRFDTPPLRLVDRDDSDRNARSRSTRRPTLTALDGGGPPPVADEGDGDLLIFAAARSAWFTREKDENDEGWITSADTGWQAAEQAARPAVGAETPAGLPKRVPQANLVPGSPLRDERPLRIVRDAASIAAHTTGYFRGWRRGQEIGGYAIGGRPGRESAGGWDFSRESTNRDEGYRPAGYRNP